MRERFAFAVLLLIQTAPTVLLHCISQTAVGARR